MSSIVASHKLPSRWWLASSYPQTALRKGATSQLIHVAVGRILILIAYWLEATLSSLPCGPLHRAAHNVATGFPQSKWARESPPGQAAAFCDLMLEVTNTVPSDSLYLLQVTKSSPHSRAGIAQGHGYKGVPGGQLRGCLGDVACAKGGVGIPGSHWINSAHLFWIDFTWRRLRVKLHFKS